MKSNSSFSVKFSNKLFIILAFAGCVPFILAAIYYVIGMEANISLNNIEKYLSLYGLVIVAFMAGSNWGIHLNSSGKWKILLPSMSNAITLVTLFAFISLSYSDYLVAQILFFIFLLLLDIKLFQSGLISKIYFDTRFSATLIVVASLFVIRIAI